MPPPQAQPAVEYNPQRALQEENEWLRSALHMAESSILNNRLEYICIYNIKEIKADTRRLKGKNK